MNPIEKFLHMFRLRKNGRPKYTQCLTHRPWLSRQVQEELLKKEVAENLKACAKGKKEEWFSKYL